jgi:hypothetical protein
LLDSFDKIDAAAGLQGNVNHSEVGLGNVNDREGFIDVARFTDNFQVKFQVDTRDQPIAS